MTAHMGSYGQARWEPVLIGNTSPKCTSCGLPPSWHLAPNTKARRTLMCWDRERNTAKRVFGMAPMTYTPPEGARSADDEWRDLVRTLDTVRVDGSEPLILADMRKRVAARPKPTVKASRPPKTTPAPTRVASADPPKRVESPVEVVIHTPAEHPVPDERIQTDAQRIEYLLGQLLEQVLRDKRKARRAARRARRMAKASA